MKFNFKYETPTEDIQAALDIEKEALEHDRDNYLNNWLERTLQERIDNPQDSDYPGRDIRDGCILAQAYKRART